MDPLFIHNFNKLRQQVLFINEYIELKFGSDFKEFLSFKESRPHVGMIVVPNDGSSSSSSLQKVDISAIDESQFRHPDQDDDEVEIGDEGVAVAWGKNVASVYAMEPEDVNVPAWDVEDDDDQDDENGQQEIQILNGDENSDEEKNDVSYYQQGYNGRYQLNGGDMNGDDDTLEDGDGGGGGGENYGDNSGENGIVFYNKSDFDLRKSFPNRLTTHITPLKRKRVPKRDGAYLNSRPPKLTKFGKRRKVKGMGRNFKKPAVKVEDLGVGNSLIGSTESTDSKEPLRHALWGITYIDAERRNGTERLVYDNYIFNYIYKSVESNTSKAEKSPAEKRGRVKSVPPSAVPVPSTALVPVARTTIPPASSSSSAPEHEAYVPSSSYKGPISLNFAPEGERSDDPSGQNIVHWEGQLGQGFWLKLQTWRKNGQAYVLS
ncbi:uncharacterized protein LOC110858914 isoform X2 [Folsomia candida]|uniref:uncharacterized protein LOC110858914 isoform X2 n=1 Tax=Folsomia candida TaxID=158441 RepID=UPI0016050D65|nr:uncharacterized protein LOC110858914 isoform X2 [Folsomia candida]